jgi:hypothetical protein
MSTKKISKSTLSMFLRTRCDRELYLSLHAEAEMEELGLPKPVKRPGIGGLASSGRDFEEERNDQLVRLFSENIEFRKSENSKKYEEIDLESILSAIDTVPVIVLQGKFSMRDCKNYALQEIGLSLDEFVAIPAIADFMPDILVVRRSTDEDIEILPNGSRKPIVSSLEKRFAIDIFDVKHTSEANPSYRAEIAMYALMLSNWIQCNSDFSKKFYVTTNTYLWTRLKQGDCNLDKLEKNENATVDELLKALRDDSEDANSRFYLASVRRFFEDVLRVIRISDTEQGGWNNLEWHVGSTCSGCDWLGDIRHLSATDKSIVSANLDSYCLSKARSSEHLSLVPGVTRGARKILELDDLPTAESLMHAAGHPVLQKHTALKRDARNLPLRSSAILSNTLSNDPDAVIASLVKSAHLLIYVSINFDSSSGLLTGLSISGVATAFESGTAPKIFRAVPYLVDQKTLQAEWVQLNAFLTQIANYIDAAENIICQAGKQKTELTGQIHFWETRQFKELCNAVGRHLPQVLSLAEKKVKSLAWLFPPEDFIGKPEPFESSTIVVVEDIIKRMVFTPDPHVVTLFDTARSYPFDKLYVQTVTDPYYREYLSNGIPRERIYEIWSNAESLKRGPLSLPRNTIISEFSNALTKQVNALESICKRLRIDYQRNFKFKTTRISTTIPLGATKVAFDSKLWIWWDLLEFNISQLENHIRLSLEGEYLEATYEAIILKDGREVASNTYEFDISKGSTEAKFKEDSLLTIGKIGHPGLPLDKVKKLLSSTPAQFDQVVNHPLWSCVAASIVQFDRVREKISVRFSNYHDPDFISYLISNSSIDLLTDIFLLEPKKPSSFDWSETSKKILQEIGDPSIAVPDQNAANAMGLKLPQSVKSKSKKNLLSSSPITPAARTLWDAGVLEKKNVVDDSIVQVVKNYVSPLDGLNESQTSAIEHAIRKALTVIWGPPGTGKTNTLASLLHGLCYEACTQGHPLKILVTGPNYKAVEEVMNRTARRLNGKKDICGSMYMCYARSRPLGEVPGDLLSNFTYTAVSIDSGDENYKKCIAELKKDSGITIIGCAIRQARRFPESFSTLPGTFVKPVFDVVVIDESSQVPVSHSLSAICGLKEDARLIIAGDHLQMPPITSIDPPSEAAYLVGSIQTYLIKRQFSESVEQCILETNYRSNEHIVAFAKKIGYPSSLSAFFPETALSLITPLPKRSQYPQSLPWCDSFDELLKPESKVVTLLHEDEVSSQGNYFEARVVAGMVWMLRQSVSASLDGRSDAVTHKTPSPSEFWENCVGIVTPHRAQRALVIRELEQLFPVDEKNLIDTAVDTVERFQGGERHTIIVTFGIADVDVISGEEAFLMQLERTNVAVSRAMAKCIVVMPNALAAYIPEDKKALATAFALKDYVEEFCNVRISTSFSDEPTARGAEVRYYQPED